MITEVVDEAAHGHGRFLVIEGDAGIGKTRLLEHARTLAAERGLRVLSARGSELESEFAFGIVRQLFEAQVAAPPERVALLSGSAAGQPRSSTAPSSRSVEPSCRSCMACTG